jgi:O-methyltransferase involved in polyketide biosynthesis
MKILRDKCIKNPEKAKAMREHYELLFPGLANSIRARVRYFDDFVKRLLSMISLTINQP